MYQAKEIHIQTAALRKKKGITQEELANNLGVSFQAVSKWENGIAFPDITLLPAIAAYFGESMETILGIEPERKSPAQNYESIKSQLANTEPEKLYEEAWNLSGVIFEALATKGWKGYVPWEIRNRLADNGYRGWGNASNIEPEGFSTMSGGLTVIGLTSDVRFPQSDDAVEIYDFLCSISDKSFLWIIFSWLNVYQKDGSNKFKSKAELTEVTGFTGEKLDIVLDKLKSMRWITEKMLRGDDQPVYKLNKALGFMPIFALLKTYVCDMHFKSLDIEIG